MSGLWFIFFVAITNVGIGFAIASYLGTRFRNANADESHWLDHDDGFDSLDEMLDPDGGEASESEPANDEDENPPTEADSPADTEATSEPPSEIAEPAAADPMTEVDAPHADPTDELREAVRGHHSPEGDEKNTSSTALAGEPPDSLDRAADALKEATPLQAAERGSQEANVLSAGARAPEDPDEESLAETMPADQSVAQEDTPAEAVYAEESSDESLDSDGEELMVEPLETGDEPRAAGEAVDDFIDELERFQRQVLETDDQLRGGLDLPDTDAIRESLQSLVEAGEEYAQQRERARADIETSWHDATEFGPLREEIDAAIEAQDARISATRKAAEGFDFDGDLREGCLAMTSETSQLIDTGHQMRDVLTDVKTRVSGPADASDLDPADQFDGLTGLESLAAMRRQLGEWADRPEREMMSLILLDVDRLTEINQEHGHRLGSVLLRELGRIAKREAADRVRVARAAGQRIALTCEGMDKTAATAIAERLRQTVELTAFKHRDERVAVTLSCGLAQADPDDSVDDLLKRAESTLLEAKRYGRNRTFTHEGKYPTPVVAPNLDLESHEVML